VKLLGCSRDARHWLVSVDVDNLFDRTYYASSYSQVWVAPGMGRRVVASIRYGF
jgi:iron complex outermembrane receptor protein